MKYIAIPYLMEEDRPGTPKFEGNVKLFEEIAKACKARASSCCTTTTTLSSRRWPTAAMALDYIYDTIPADLLQTEVDTCWVKVAGEDPAAYVKKYTGRSPLVHLKDFHKEGRPANSVPAHRHRGGGAGEPRHLRVPPRGPRRPGPRAPFWRPLWEAGAQWVVVEQDQSNGRTPMEAITLSRQYLKEQGW